MRISDWSSDVCSSDLTSILMVSCAADPAGAREQASMSAANKDSALPFHDPAVVLLAEAVARGDTARIAALAPATDLSARGDDTVTLLDCAIWNQQPDPLSALPASGGDPSAPGMDPATVAPMAGGAADTRSETQRGGTACIRTGIPRGPPSK